MVFVKERLPIYNDRKEFDKFIDNGFFEIIDYSDLGNDFVDKNHDLIINLIRNGKYFLTSKSPSNIKNNYIYYIASFEFGNLKPLFFYKGDVHIFDEFFYSHRNLVDFDFFDNKIKLKKLLDMDFSVTDIYFDLLNEKINNGSFDKSLFEQEYYEKVVVRLSDSSLIKLYGQNVLKFIKKYGYNIVINGDWEYLRSVSEDDLNKFFDVFPLENGSISNLLNLYKALVDYNFLYKSRSEVLNGHSFSLIRPDNLDYISLLVKELNDILTIDDKKQFLRECSLEELFNKYISLFKSSDYDKFNLYSSLIRNICSFAYNKKRDNFVREKNNFDGGFPFKLDVNVKIKKIINKKKLMSKMSYEVAYDYDKLLLLKKHLVDNGFIDDDFDTNVLFALLTDGVKGIKLIDLGNIDKNYLIGKIKNYISSLIDDSSLYDDVSFNDIKDLPLNDSCFSASSNVLNIVNEIDLKKFFENVIHNEKVYNLFKNYANKYDIFCFTSVLSLCDVCYNGDVCYSDPNLIMFINNFSEVVYDSSKNVYGVFFDMLKKASFVNNPLNRYERIFGDANKWIISDPPSNSSFASPDERIQECLDVYKQMLDRKYISVPVVYLKKDGLTITNDNFYDPAMLVTGEILSSCMRARGTLDSLFRYTLTNPQGFNIIIKNDSNLISRIAGVCFGNTIFLNELREDVSRKYSNRTLFKLLEQYILDLVKKAYKYNHIIEQVFIVHGLQGTRDINDNVIKNPMFLDLKNGKYEFKMDYSDKAICLYGGSNIKPINFQGRRYDISRFKALSGDDSIFRINMLRCLYNNEWDYIEHFDRSICGANWYVYSVNGEIISFISPDNISKETFDEYENAKSIISVKKKV